MAGFADVCVGVVMGGAFALVPGLCRGEEVRSAGGVVGWVMDVRVCVRVGGGI